MGILTDLTKPSAKVTSCKIRTILDDLQPDDAKIFLDAVMDQSWKVAHLTDELRKRGIEISAPTIRNHRIGACSCSKI